jgi:hypothetical protein
MTSYEYRPSHFARASEMLDRLDEATHHVNDKPVTPLTEAGADTIATVALAHAVLAMVEQAQELPDALDGPSRALSALASAISSPKASTVWGR